MITTGACLRCKGAVIDYGCDVADGPLCIACGWRRSDISPEIEAEVEEYLGEIHIGSRYVHRQALPHRKTEEERRSGKLEAAC